MNEDIEKINKAIDEFAKTMKRKMLEKYYKGFEGWDDIGGNERDILDRLIEHAQRGKGQEVDVANFAMMLWHNERKGV